ncbi:D-beta-D-heptose 1-phosphate adenosyltransferase, partial [Actinospica acidiphila]|nr:D-beta-D-heptose 1-phosphate adenosyltransferase [Actinospica acidiphila]
MTGPEPLVVVGDVLLDEDIEGVATRLAPDAPAPVVDVTGDHRHPGGAGLAAALAARGGRDVVLVTALGDDPASEAVRQQLAGRVRLLELPLHGTLPVKTRVLAGGRPLVRIDRGGGM